MSANYLPDTLAMDAIAEAMSGATWNPDLLDAIAELVRRTGRDIEDLPA